MRYNIIDNIKGIAFILMILHHILYIYDVTFYTNYSNNDIIQISGFTARHLFLLIVGMSLIYSYKNNKSNFYKKRINNSFKILLHALLITLITYYYYPNKFIRFGILHSIAIMTLLLSSIIKYDKYYEIILLIFIILNYIEIPSINNHIDLILGQVMPNYNMIDWFPILKCLPVVLSGMIFANKIDLTNFNHINNNILSFIGKNCLELYTLHLYILIILYNTIKSIY